MRESKISLFGNETLLKQLNIAFTYKVMPLLGEEKIHSGKVM